MRVAEENRAFFRDSLVGGQLQKKVLDARERSGCLFYFFIFRFSGDKKNKK